MFSFQLLLTNLNVTKMAGHMCSKERKGAAAEVLFAA